MSIRAIYVISFPLEEPIVFYYNIMNQVIKSLWDTWKNADLQIWSISWGQNGYG